MKDRIYRSRTLALGLAVTVLVTSGGISAAAQTTDKELQDFQNWLDGLTIVHHGTQTFSSSGTATREKPVVADAEAYARESVALTNAQRADNGLDELVLDEAMMEVAAVRAKELAELYSHERPDGTRVSQEYYWAEIITIRPTPGEAVESWMASTKGHREIILAEKYRSAGAGCYQAEDGTVYWVQLFSRA